MRSFRHFLALTWVAALAVTGVVASAPARADDGRRIYGDVSADGVQDEIVLPEWVLRDAGGFCPLVVRQGAQGGGYSEPVVHRFRVAGDDDIQYCPDMGVVVDLGGDGTAEVILTF